MSNADKNNNDQANLMFSFGAEMAEIFESFLIETQEIFDRLNQDLLELEKRPTDKELHNTIFRAVHTVKGTSSFVGFEQLTELAHNFEDVLNKIRRGELTVTSDIMDVMFEAFDLMKELLQRIQAKNTEPIELTGIIAKLQVIGQTAQESPKEPPVPIDQSTLTETEPIPQAALEATAQPIVETKSATTDATPATASSSAQAKVIDSTIRVDITRLDGLMNLVGELVLGRNRLSQIAYQLNEQYEGIQAVRELADTSSQIDFITTELQMAVMKTRMVPIAKVFNKLPRLIRDLSKDMGKDIDLQIFGEETELDKSIIEELNDPLVHILRNAADHGVETPEERIAAGKPAQGKIIIKAEHEGNHIVIAIEDDGKGMDPEKLKSKAIEKGLLTEAEAKEMTKREVLNLIFLPGFSTAAKVTNVSGRGVGMDVVRTNIAKLKGIIDIDSEIGAGSKFTIKLPLTLAIIQGLLVESKKEIFSIPLASVLEVVRVQASEISTINGKEVIRLRDTVLSLVHIDVVFGRERSVERPAWMYIVVIGLGERRLGIVVDSLLGQREVVIKSLGEYLGTIPGIAGSTILGDGRVIMIIDVGQFMALCSKGALTTQEIVYN